MVLILEHLEESLVYLSETLCWPLWTVTGLRKKERIGWKLNQANGLVFCGQGDFRRSRIPCRD